eukprot:3129977-Pyramimonas_sp.AAC.1
MPVVDVLHKLDWAPAELARDLLACQRCEGKRTAPRTRSRQHQGLVTCPVPAGVEGLRANQSLDYG